MEPTSDHLDAELDRILAESCIHTLFQPIIRTRDRSIIGYEALARGPRGSVLENPAQLFAIAERTDRSHELDLLCQRQAIRAFARLKLPGRLFINILSDSLAHPSNLLGNIESAIAEHGLHAHQVVLELTEHRPLPQHEDTVGVLHELRHRGHPIALDDVGGGHNGLRLWHALLPDFIKVDRHFVRGLDYDPMRRKFVAGMAELANRVGCQIIAEGVEEMGEFDWLSSFDVPLAQGYLFGVPLAEPPHKLHLPEASVLHRKDQTRQRSNKLEALLRHIQPISPEQTVEAVGEYFLKHPKERYVPAVSNGLPIGIVWRMQFMDMFARRFGLELYGRKPILQFVDTKIQIGEASLSLEAMSRRITRCTSEEMTEAFIITRNGHYVGMGELRELLRTLTDLQIRNARHANPLTGLPGNTPINETMQDWLQVKRPFVACYVDLDQFKAYNDVYGYQKGDEAIILVARLLRQFVNSEHDFVGHIGGDDFMVLFQSEDWESRIRAMLDSFEAAVATFYDNEDRARGGIMATDRQGTERLIPMMSLSVGAVPCTPDAFSSHLEVGARLSEVKKMAKKIAGNSLFVDRRGETRACTPDKQRS